MTTLDTAIALLVCLVEFYAAAALMFIGFGFMLGGPSLAKRAGKASLVPVAALATASVSGLAHLATMAGHILVRVIKGFLVHVIDPVLDVLRLIIARVLFPRR